MTLVITQDRCDRAVWPSGVVTRMHIRCDGCTEPTYAPGGTYAHNAEDEFTRLAVEGAAVDAGWRVLSCGGHACPKCQRAIASFVSYLEDT